MNKKISILLTFSLLCVSCEKLFIDDKNDSSNKVTFNEVWSVLDDRYSLFELKNIDWNFIYSKYEPKITESLTDQNLLTELGNMIKELKDSHTDITTKNSVVYYWPLNDEYMKRFDLKVIKQYYHLQGLTAFNAVTYGIIDDIGYVNIKNFSEEISKKQVLQLFADLSATQAIIFDVRNNTGGNETYGNNIIRSLISESLTNKIIKIKNGKDHNAFLTINSKIDPDEFVDYKGEIVVLANKVTYSAANSFVNTISLLPNVTIIGDTTGGGGSTPYNYELSNGWILRYSSTIEYRPSDSLVIDKGIPPHHHIDQIKNDKKDNVLDFAMNFIHSR